MGADLYLAEKLYNNGDAVASENMCRSAINSDEDAAGACFLLARISYGQKKYPASLEYIAEARRRGAGEEDHAYLAGLNHYARHDFGAARRSFLAVLASEPGNRDARRNLGIIERDEGDIAGAIEHFCAALDLEPADELIRRNLCDALQKFDWNSGGASVVAAKRHLEAGFKLPKFNMKRYLPIVADAILSSGQVLHAIKYLESTRLDQTSQMTRQNWFTQLSNDPLFQALLKADVITAPAFENLLTHIRRRLLRLAVTDEAALNLVPLNFAMALAHQVYLTEFVYHIDGPEQDELAELRAGISAAIEIGHLSGQESALKLAVSVAYPSPDGWTSGVHEALNKIGLGSLARLQVSEPEAEAELKNEIKTLSPIEDGVSRQVRTQYEQNPFPRWSLLSRPAPGSVGDTLRFLFPHARVPKKMFGPGSILIAGCGTGHQPIVEALRYPASNITAIDLSRASLAYAIRRTEKFGVKNIRYFQADILDVELLGEVFDIIECTGVLHHMEDPLAGWQALITQLAPGGLMKIALYSRLGRRHITLVREWIAERQLTVSDQAIRDLRREIFDLPENDAKRNALGFTDFYSVSGARDLLFHVKEHTFSFIKIKAALLEFDLELIGLQVTDNELKEQYLTRFPDDPAMTDLDNWHAFEIDYPDSFSQMYNFWCRKAGPGDPPINGPQFV
jgi:SAM-dependent methyltransferase